MPPLQSLSHIAAYVSQEVIQKGWPCAKEFLVDSLLLPDAWQKDLSLVALGLKAKPSFDDPTKQDTNRAGALKWRVVATDKDGGVYEVTVTGEKPQVERFQPVWFGGLTVGGSKNGLWWAASSAVAMVQKNG